jgi:cation transport regulator ChaC
MTRIAVFGYGSLVSPASAGEALGRPVAGPTPACLEGFSRSWSLGRDNLRSEKTFARADGSLPRFCMGLNLEPAQAAARAPNGALIDVTEDELERLDVREMRYRRIDVTDSIVTDAGGAYDTVLAYTARAEHHHPAPPEDAIVISNYIHTVEAAFAALGPEQLDLFRATTPPPPVEVAEATLVRDEIPAGNPRGW